MSTYDPRCASDELVAGGWLASLDSRIKVVAALATIGSVLAASTAVFPALVTVLCLVGLRGTSKRLILARLAAPLGLALLTGSMQAFLRGSTPLVELAVLGHRATITREGLACAVLFASRVLASASVLLLLGRTTPSHRLFSVLRWLRLPASWVAVAMLTFRYLFVLGEVAATIADARRLRLATCGLSRRLASAGAVAGAVLLRSMDHAEATHQAMVLRGYCGEIPTPPGARLGATGVAALVVAVAAPAVVLLLVQLVGVGP